MRKTTDLMPCGIGGMFDGLSEKIVWRMQIDRFFYSSTAIQPQRSAMNTSCGVKRDL